MMSLSCLHTGWLQIMDWTISSTGRLFRVTLKNCYSLCLQTYIQQTVCNILFFTKIGCSISEKLISQCNCLHEDWIQNIVRKFFFFLHKTIHLPWYHYFFSQLLFMEIYFAAVSVFCAVYSKTFCSYIFKNLLRSYVKFSLKMLCGRA